jgi:hypothetical protein
MDSMKSWKRSGVRRGWMTALTVPIVVGAAAIASADVPKTWVAAETLTAVDLNANFDALDAAITALADRVEALEAPPTVLEATSSTSEISAASQDLVYQSMELALPPGTWRIDAFATVETTINPDGIQIGLWDDTNGEEIAGARGPYGTTASDSPSGISAPCDGTTTFCSALPLTTSKVVTLNAATTIRLAAFRNGYSRVRLTPGAVVQPGHRLVATKLD